MKITLKPLFLTSGISLALIFASCVGPKKSVELADTIDEGVIEYSILWPKSVMDAGLSFILPKKATMWFNQENQRYVVNGAMELFSLQLINSSKGDTLYTIFEGINQKIYTQNLLTQEVDWMRMKDNWKTVIVNDSVKLIQNLECKKALLFEPNSIGPTAVVWFTERINTKQLYSNTPFETIPGVIMEISGKYKADNFALKAISIEEKEAPANWFVTPPNGYNLVNKEEIEERLKNIFR